MTITTFYYNGIKDAREGFVANPFRYGPHSNREYGDYMKGYNSVTYSGEIKKLDSDERGNDGE